MCPFSYPLVALLSAMKSDASKTTLVNVNTLVPTGSTQTHGPQLPSATLERGFWKAMDLRGASRETAVCSGQIGTNAQVFARTHQILAKSECRMIAVWLTKRCDFATLRRHFSDVAVTSTQVAHFRLRLQSSCRCCGRIALRFVGAN